MAAQITTSTELFHKFHTCEMYVKQGKIATCLMAFKNIIDSHKAVPLTDKEKKEFNEGVDVFLKNLSLHKKFLELFGEVKFGDTDLETNLEFVKSMIAAQEEEIVDKVHKDEEAAEAQRIDMEKIDLKKKEELQQIIDEAIKLIDEEKLSKAIEVIGNIEEIRDAVIMHFNDKGMHCREAKNFEEAVKCYSKALSVSPQDENLHYNVGRAYYEHNVLDKAEEYLGKALKINPDFKEGKTFHDYLIKLKQAKNGAEGAVADNKLKGFFKKISSLKKLFKK